MAEVWGSLQAHSPFFNPETEFVHFTSPSAVTSILNSKVFRLFSLNNMTDSDELIHIRKKLNYPDFIEFDKVHYFSMSMCSAKILDDSQALTDLWNEHGHKGAGVMLRIRVENDLIDWYNYHLSTIFYAYDILAPIAQLNSITKREYLTSKIGCFFKLPKYHKERECRLLFDHSTNHQVFCYNNRNELIYPILHPKDATNKIFYVELPIYSLNKNVDGLFYAPNPEGRLYQKPMLSISEIVFGDKCPKDIVDKIRTMAFDADASIQLSTALMTVTV